MIEGRITEINIDKVKARVQRAVQRRMSEGAPVSERTTVERRKLLFKDTAALESLLLESLPVSDANSTTSEFYAQAEAAAEHKSARRYHIDNLLKYDDQEFVWNVYLALLKREPDEEGLQRHLRELRSGRANKIDVLGRVRYSAEGKRKNVPIDGLRARAAVRRLYRAGRRLLSR
jgi:hypothetical protein